MPLALTAHGDSTDTSRRFDYGVSAITEMQWNPRNGKTAWANLFSAELGVKTWQGGRFELGGIATFTAGNAEVNCLQDFSNINAESRGFRLVHAGIAQEAGAFRLFAGLRQADKDYWNTPLAGHFMGSSYGCLPTVNDNYGLNVYPLATLGLHAEWDVTPRLTLKESVYNGVASDRLDRQFRFRPGRDGVLNLGSAVFTLPEKFEGAEAATYLLAYNLGTQYYEEDNSRETLFGLWATVEQPLLSFGGTNLSAAATGAYQFSGVSTTKGYWNGSLVMTHLSPLDIAAGVGVSRAYYEDGKNETDVDVTISLSPVKCLSVQPAVHFLRTNGRSSFATHLRVTWEL